MDSLSLELLQVDWDSLDHAYGQAGDAPTQLLALVGDDPEARSGAVGYLDAAMLHQGSVYSATAPLALLSDEHPGVRACAALAAEFSGDQRATRELVSALEAPQDADRWFTGWLPARPGRLAPP